MLEKDDLKLKINEQVSPDLNTAITSQMTAALLNIHTMLPGIIVSFNAVRQTAVVQPSLKRIFTEKGAVNLPVCVDVPIEFPGGGGYFMTFPIKPGDECCLCFSERAIDFWFAMGGVQLPSEYRLHDLSDAIARVGLNSQPNIIPNFFTGGAEFRNKAGGSYVRIADNGNVTTKSGNSNTVLTSNSFTINTLNVIINGNLQISGTTVGNGINLNTHLHTGVQPGGGNTGVPI